MRLTAVESGVPLALNKQLEANLARWAELRAENGWPVDLKQLHQLLDNVVAHYRPAELYLFGSLVNGNFDAGSDIDMLIVVPDDAEQGRRTGERAQLMRQGSSLPVDVFVTSKSRFEGQRSWLNGLASEVAASGVLLHAA
jgi:predicted nucleotidyltransferase